MKLIEQATVEDTNGNYIEALELYKVALESFKKALDGKSWIIMYSIVNEQFLILRAL